MKLFQASHITTLVVLSVLSTTTAVLAQTEKPVRVTVTEADQAAATQFSNLYIHGLPRIGAGNINQNLGRQAAGSSTNIHTLAMPATIPGAPSPGFYPADLTNQGGAVLPVAVISNVLVNAPPSTWGYPGAFLKNLFQSDFIHVLDQYVGTIANDRYTVGPSIAVNYPVLTTLGDNDTLEIVHAVAAANGAGYGHIYNIFLPKGVDYCTSGECYSPDHLSTFAFCAFHDSVVFSDIGEVVFTVEPDQNVPGCQVAPGSPNGQLIDSTANVLAHETFAAITDPDGTGWLAFNSIPAFGGEAADLCQSVSLNTPPTGSYSYFQSPWSTLNGTQYEIQFMYSNTYHACANVP